MTSGMWCFLGIIYAAIFVAALKFPSIRNEWVILAAFYVVGMTMFAIYAIAQQLPWIILAASGGAVPVAVAFRIAVPGIQALRGRRLNGDDPGFVIEAPRPQRRLLGWGKQRRLRG